MTQITCRLAAKNRDQLRNPTLGNRVWATFTFYRQSERCSSERYRQQSAANCASLVRRYGARQRWCETEPAAHQSSPSFNHCHFPVLINGRSYAMPQWRSQNTLPHRLSPPMRWGAGAFGSYFSNNYFDCLSEL